MRPLRPLQAIVPTEYWEYRRDFPFEENQGKVDALSGESVEFQGQTQVDDIKKSFSCVGVEFKMWKYQRLHFISQTLHALLGKKHS